MAEADNSGDSLTIPQNQSAQIEPKSTTQVFRHSRPHNKSGRFQSQGHGQTHKSIRKHRRKKERQQKKAAKKAMKKIALEALQDAIRETSGE